MPVGRYNFLCYKIEPRNEKLNICGENYLRKCFTLKEAEDNTS